MKPVAMRKIMPIPHACGGEPYAIIGATSVSNQFPTPVGVNRYAAIAKAADVFNSPRLWG